MHSLNWNPKRNPGGIPRPALNWWRNHIVGGNAEG